MLFSNIHAILLKTISHYTNPHGGTKYTKLYGGTKYTELYDGTNIPNHTAASLIKETQPMARQSTHRHIHTDPPSRG